MTTRSTAPDAPAHLPLDVIPEPASFALPDSPQAERPAPAAPTPAAGSPGAAGAITLVRHGEPALSRRVKLNAAGYRRWWAVYEEGGLLAGQVPPPGLPELAARADAVFASTRRRAVESARMVCGQAPFATDPVFIEAPLPPPPFPGLVRFSPKVWGFLVRFCWWWFDYHETQESQRQATVRAQRAADKLVAAAAGGREVLLLAHGFFNAMIARELKRRGWRNVSGRGYRYWTARRFERG